MSSGRRSTVEEDGHSTPRRRARQRNSHGSRDSDENLLGSSSHSRSSRGRKGRRSDEFTSRRDSDQSAEFKDNRSSSQAGLGERSRDRTYNPASRSERVSRVLDAADEASPQSGWARGSGSAHSHEDELERIRGIRARRMRQERLLVERNDDASKSPAPNETRRTEHRQRRRELREAKADGETMTSPRQHRSTPAISRRELEDAGLVPSGRARRNDTHSKQPNRPRSNRLKDLSPSRDDDGTSMASTRRRRDRSERVASETGTESRWDRLEDIDARLRARRARRNATDSGSVAYKIDASIDERQTRDKLSLPATSHDIMEESGHLGVSAGSGGTENSSRRSDGMPRQTTARRSPPPRSKSVDEEQMQSGIDPNLLDRGARRRERQQLRMKTLDTRTTDLTERLRVRREARAAERVSSSSAIQLKTKLTSEMPSLETQTSETQSPLTRSPTTQTTLSGQSPLILSNGQLVREKSTLSPSSPLSDRNDHKAVKPPMPQQNLDDLEPNIFSGDEDAKWSLKLKVLSAEDLPLHIVPTMPLCPFMKAGFVQLPQGFSGNATSEVMEKLGSKSVEKVKSSQVRYTTSKILSKRDNGMVDFSEELRWDDIANPEEVALVLELFARNVDTPQNIEESPVPLNQCDAFRVRMENEVSRQVDANGDPVRSLGRNKSNEAGSNRGFGAFWSRAANKKAAELQAAEAAAEIARRIIEEESKTTGDTKVISDAAEASKDVPMKLTTTPQSDYEVTLCKPRRDSKIEITEQEDVRIGLLVLPLTKLPIGEVMEGEGIVQLEQWYKLEKSEYLPGASVSGWKDPSVRLEIVFGRRETLDKEEEEINVEEVVDVEPPKSPKKRVSMINPSAVRKQAEEVVVEDPVLEPGVIDFLSVVGCRDIGSQKNDLGHKGWVDSTPESVILEQFPPNNEFHQKSGRNALLPEMIQWFCFPEGCRLWRGTGPPSHQDLKLTRFSASSPSNIASSLSIFDACLGCTTSFSWFVIASNSDEYGSKMVKTYSAVIRFYAPAPLGIDPTQEDFAQSSSNRTKSSGPIKRLWVPIGICLTSNLPIIGIMEAMLLRICEGLALDNSSDQSMKINESLKNAILEFQKPIAGAVNSSIPFLSGSRFLISIPPPKGLPALPHGRSVVSVCRLLGAEGLIFLLAAVLTECKILIHAQDIADIAMVAEVITALTYPFTWSLPYIPILPVGMLEFVEAPLSFMLGISTCNLQLIDPYALEDIVVIDLDNGILPSELLESVRRTSKVDRKTPTPLPTNVATNISKAWHRLLRAEEEVEEHFGFAMLGEQSLPRLEGESLAEREFRIAVAFEISSLLRGYDDCVGPVFNRDKFLKISPALFEERQSRGVGNVLSPRSRRSSHKSISPRSKRFLSLLVNTQNFQQLLESLETDEAWPFHEIMKTFEDSSSDGISNSRTESSSTRSDKLLLQLGKKLQKIEDKVPTYLVDQTENFDSEIMMEDDIFDDNDGEWFENLEIDATASNAEDTFRCITDNVLTQIDCPSAPEGSSGANPNAISLEYLQKLESTPWEYKPIFSIPVDPDDDDDFEVHSKAKVKLREAIGDRRFREWKIARDKKSGGDVDLAFLHESIRAPKQSVAVDLGSLVSSATDDTATMMSMSSSSSSSSLRSTLSPEQQRVEDAKTRDLIRRCLDKANVSHEKWSEDDSENDDTSSNPFLENGRDLMEETEKALRNPSAQRFLLSILAQRSRLENQRLRNLRHRQSKARAAASRLSEIAFECLVRLSCAMLDSCMEYSEFELAYRLLTHTAGFVMVTKFENIEEEGEIESVVSMTSRIGLHPIFANLGVWRTVMSLHLRDRLSEIKSETTSSDDDESEEEEEEGVLEYEAAVAILYEMVGYRIPGEELSRFAMQASEENGWFCDDRGRQLLMIARRIAIRRDQGEIGGAGDQDYMDLISNSQESESAFSSLSIAEIDNRKWMEFGWCHPAAPSSVIRQDAKAPESSSELMKRSPITAFASIGSSVIASGGVDGSVFLAILDVSNNGETAPKVRGIHLDWGSASRASTGLSSDGVYGVGAISCLAASSGSGQHATMKSSKDSRNDASRQEAILASMEGSRVVAGTTAGDLRVWSVKDIYSAVLASRKGDDIDTKSTFGGGNVSNRLKFALRGRALAGHRGGVTCIDVPSHVYRPDSLVTGGADGLIKLWSLRALATGRRSSSMTSARDAESVGNQSRGGDALNIFTGHRGRVMCVLSAWHGDRLLSGGADRTLRVWDLAGGNAKCLNKLSGHSGWVKMVKYWGPNTVVSASTDRSIALWDARLRDSPLFMLLSHSSPVSDFLVGSRTDPMMVSAGTDGTISTWDFRKLSGSRSTKTGTPDNADCQVVRLPSRDLNHKVTGVEKLATSSVRLAKGFSNSTSSFLSVGSDAVVREWDTASGQPLDSFATGHCDAITCFESFGQSHGMNPNICSPSRLHEGMITSSWDGTIRMRRLVREP